MTNRTSGAPYQLSDFISQFDPQLEKDSLKAQRLRQIKVRHQTDQHDKHEHQNYQHVKIEHQTDRHEKIEHENAEPPPLQPDSV